ncbi:MULTISPECIES: YecH family metal-binding protein [unclassified Atlantibacter]|uniref:YecH family metal-binding protein n=1 Tax=unclassified Atlantibacter TaxID=2649394 RepID=UPI0016069228|nr:MULTISPECIES: YecH family metal-binding protein [unclassified Atlantibacter]MBB3321074.1 putative metal-binding protein [Atlantibacter sp. RC6]
MTSIHGHEVLTMMLADGQCWTTERLVAAIEEKFGQAARFYTCSAQGMTAGELVEFLAARGKFIPQDEGFVTHKSKICNH